METATGWQDYAILDTGDGEKVERWGEYILRRPDPQVIWPWQKDVQLRENVHARYHRSSKGGGEWEYRKKLPASWQISYGELNFRIEPTGFKHTGLFPEQAVNWDWMTDLIKRADRPISVLNLFAYTGGATCAAASAGASVCHVDASKGMVGWARENARLSGLSEKPIRYIIEDCLKFVEREIRRGRYYDAIIMDPPSYGRGPNGELWKLEDELYHLIQTCVGVLSETPLYFLVNSYTTGFSPRVAENILGIHMAKRPSGLLTSGEIGLPTSSNAVYLPCGSFARWQAFI